MQKKRNMDPRSLMRFSKLFEDWLDADSLRRMIVLEVTHLDGSFSIKIDVNTPYGAEGILFAQYCFAVPPQGRQGFVKFCHLMQHLTTYLYHKYSDDLYIAGYLYNNKYTSESSYINIGIDAEDDRWTDSTILENGKPRKGRRPKG